MLYIDEEDALLHQQYETTIDDYYEFLLQEDIREIPSRKQSAKERLIFQLVTIAVICIILFFVKVEPLVFLGMAGIAVLMVIIFFISFFYAADNTKNIQALLKNAKKHGDEKMVPMEFWLCENGIIFTEGEEKWVVKAKEIEVMYETENLLVIIMKYGRDIAVSDAEKVILPKRVFSETDYNMVKDTVTAMLKQEAEKLAKK